MFKAGSRLLNAALNWDEASKDRITALEGKVATIELLPLHFVFQLSFVDQEIVITKGETLPADIKIAGTPLQLLGMTVRELEIEGDAALGQTILALFKEYRADWEDCFAKMIGDVPAYHANRFLKKVSHYVKRFQSNAVEMTKEYIHEEAMCFPSSEELSDFYEEVDVLREAVDRLEARLHVQ